MSWVFRRIMNGAHSPTQHPAPHHPASKAFTELQAVMANLELTMQQQHQKQQHKCASRGQLQTIYKMLTLFQKAFEDVPPEGVPEIFPELSSFTMHATRLMVSELRCRGANKSTEVAVQAILEFLNPPKPGEAETLGWTLLNTLHILAATNQKVVDIMATMSLPSTLVKCLYLCFDLPPVDPLDETESRLRLQAVFVETLVRLCRHSSPAEELVQKDDMSLLFLAISSWCPPYNQGWRHGAADILRMLARRGLSNNVLRYIHGKQWVARCTHSALRSPDLYVIDAAETLVCLLCFLRDSSEASPILLEDFQACCGYDNLPNFLLRLESEGGKEAYSCLWDLVTVIASLTPYGAKELLPMMPSGGASFLLPGFSLPQPLGQGLSIRNAEAYTVLEAVFLRAHDETLALAALDGITSIHLSDRANYFSLSRAGHTTGLASVASLGPPRSAALRARYLDFMDFLVLRLHYIPPVELTGLASIFRSCPGAAGLPLAESLLRYLRHAPNQLREAYREAGLLEALTGCLHWHSATVRRRDRPKRGLSRNDITLLLGEEETEEEFAAVVLDLLMLLLQNSASNIDVFRECGGPRGLHALLGDSHCRTHALAVAQQLLLSAWGEDEMIALLALANALPRHALCQCADILMAIVSVLLESHRCRRSFRRAGGFVHVLALLVSAEGTLACPDGLTECGNENPSAALDLAQASVRIITAAMRHEPANSHHFATEVRYDKLAEALRLLGCFCSANGPGKTLCQDSSLPPDQRFVDCFIDALHSRVADLDVAESIPPTLHHCCSIFYFMFQMATDVFDRFPPRNPGWPGFTPGLDVPFLAHPEAVLAIVELLPCVINTEKPQHATALQLAVLDQLMALVQSERNQQVLGEVGLPARILRCGHIALVNEDHPMHVGLLQLFERLACHSLEPAVLRAFLRLGNPLNCGSWEIRDLVLHRTHKYSDACHDVNALEPQKLVMPNTSSARLCRNLLFPLEGSEVPLTRVKFLVSVTTPLHARLSVAAVPPPFVEFDMSIEGFGCLFLPSLAPHNMGTSSATSPMDGTGMGTGDHVFPPPSGLSYSLWFTVERHDSPMHPHPTRLLTLVRHDVDRGKATAGSVGQGFVCLVLLLLPRHHTVMLSTQDQPLHELDETPHEGSVCFPTPELGLEGQWHHLVLVLNRGVLKASSASLYIDSVLVGTAKVPYITTPPASVGSSAPPASVCCYIGTPPVRRHTATLIWRFAAAHLIEEPLPPQSISTMYSLGLHYMGSFQAVSPQDGKSDGGSSAQIALIPEEHLSFGLFPFKTSSLTVAKIRRAYNKVDARAIARQLGLSSHESATPVTFLHNAVGHLAGPARTIGAALIGNLGVRCWVGRAVASSLQCVGGPAVLLGLVAAARDVESLYAAFKALACTVRGSPLARSEMERVSGYRLLAFLLKKKHHLLNTHVLHLAVSLVGMTESGRDRDTCLSFPAFRDLLIDLKIWFYSLCDLHISLLDHLSELLLESSDAEWVQSCMLRLALLPKLLRALSFGPRSLLSPTTLAATSHFLTLLLKDIPSKHDLLSLGQFLAWTLPATPVSEKTVELISELSEEAAEEGTEEEEEEEEESEQSTADREALPPTCAHIIRLRNCLLGVMQDLVFSHTEKNLLNTQTCEEILRVLGFDWVLLFLQPHVHPSTAVLGVRLLAALISHSPILRRFQEGTPGGGWLNRPLGDHTSPGHITGLNMEYGNRPGGKSSREVNAEVCMLPGFSVLCSSLPHHSEQPQIYVLLLALFLNRPLHGIPPDVQLDLDSIWRFSLGMRPTIFSVPPTIVSPCLEPLLVLLSILRFTLGQPLQADSDGSWLVEYPVTVLQFLQYLYHNVAGLMSAWLHPEFLSALAASIFPFSLPPATEEDEGPDQLEEALPEEGTDSGPESPDLQKQDWGEQMETQKALSTHPGRKLVMDLLRTIAVDSLLQGSSNKQGPPLIDLLLEAGPEQGSVQQRQEFQSELLQGIMDHLMSADALSDNGTNHSSYMVVAYGIFHFAQKVVDKLWQRMFIREPQLVFKFITQLIAQAKQRSQGLCLDSLYNSLNRTTLFLLSRSRHGPQQQEAMCQSLRLLLSHVPLLFGPTNYQPEFFSCIIHCLLQIRLNRFEDGFGLELETGNSSWHVLVPADLEEETAQQHVIPEDHELCQLLLCLWKELQVNKRHLLEALVPGGLGLPSSALKRDQSPGPRASPRGPTRKMHVHSHGEPQIASGSPLAKSDDLACLWHFLSEPAVRAWQVFLGQERKQSAKADQHMASARRARFWVMGSFGFIKLSSKQRRKAGFKPKNRISLQDAAAWTLTHIAVVRDLVESRFNQWEEGEQSIQNMLEEEWTDMEAELLRERGLWGPSVGSRLDKWQLEPCEGPCRMRRRLVPNNTFYSLYPCHWEEHESDVNRNEYSHNEDQTDFHKINGSTKAMHEYDKEDCTCLTSSEHTVIRGNNGESHTTDLDALDEHEDSVELEGLAKLDLESMAGDEDATSEGLESEPITEDLLVSGRTSQTNYLAVQYLLEDGEKVSHMFRYARVEGLDTREGILLFGKENFYLIDGVTVTEEGELCQIDLFPSELYEPVLPWVTRPRALTFQHRSSRFPYESLREVHRWRYLLQPIAVEVFLSDGQTFMLAFSRGIRNKVFQRFLAMAPSLADSSESVSGQNPNASVEAGSGLLGNLVGTKSVTQRWLQGEISNFQYLMHLNTLAGRSYNDLMQYPVFPWILADYDSEELDLKDPATFRDLSKPMGAQTERRLQQFVKRFQEWEDPHGAQQPWQGDTPAYHYGTHYSSAMIVAFYLVRMEPFAQTFLRLQGGHFDLADRMFHSIRDTWLSASCNNMADVKELIPEFFYLPEFLRNDNNFNLGCKQNGTRLADVVLPPWAKGDVHRFICVHRQALECDYVSSNLHRWIDLIFGYKQRGPDSVPAANVFHPLFYEGSVDLHNIQDQLQLTATIGFINNFGQIPTQLFKKPHPVKHVCERGGIYFHQQHVPFMLKQLQLKELHGPVGQIVSSERGVLAVEQHKVLIPPAYQRSLAWGFADLSCHISQYESDKVLAVFECLWDWGPLLCAVCPSARTIICGGTATVLCIFEICVQRDHKPSLKLKQVLHGHTAAVTCLAVSQVFHLLISGSRDCTCILWDMNSPRFLTQLRGHTAPVSAVCVSELTGKIVSCAGSDVFLWSINGEPLAWASCALGPPILCCCFAEIEEWDTDNKVVTGHADGVLQMWRCEYQQVLNDAVPKEIRIGFEHEKHSTVSEVSAETERGQEDNNSSDSDNLLETLQPPSTQDTEGSTENNCGKQSSVVPTGRVNDVSDSGLSIEPVASAERDGFHLHSYAASEEASPSEPMDSTSNILLSEAGGGLETPSRNCGEECRRHSREESYNMNRESGRQSPLSKQAFQWERQLVLSRKIHIFKSSAYEQASITALALSRDHNCLLLGDSCGRVFSCTGSTRKKRGENK